LPSALSPISTTLPSLDRHALSPLRHSP
jgi:hypothetical protein